MNWKQRYEPLNVGDEVKIIKLKRGNTLTNADYIRTKKLVGQTRIIIEIQDNQNIKLNITCPNQGFAWWWDRDELEKVN